MCSLHSKKSRVEKHYQMQIASVNPQTKAPSDNSVQHRVVAKNHPQAQQKETGSCDHSEAANIPR